MTPLVIPARNAVADRISSEEAKPIAAIAAAKAKPATIDAKPAAQAMRDEAREWHRHDPASGESQKRKAEPRIGKREVRLDAGNRRRPRANSKAIRQKNAERS